ncbi:uncharacterized protein [Dermacentor andersoni]|uniref:uncharacterized protein n=1 Tax=Dermacentor andersoni TaxID=34620 RepID=UPI0024164494|nr:uncharacterized protein LOC129387936 [Dermacentor andersoni]
MSDRGLARRLLSGLLLAAYLLSQWPRPAHSATPQGVSNLGSRLCTANPFIVWANETGEGSAGALMVWLLATRDIMPYCDLHIVAPEGAGVVMHFLSASLRKASPRRPLQREPLRPQDCVDTVTVVHVPSDEAYWARNDSTEAARGTTLVETTCVQKKLTARPHLSPHESTHALTRIRLVVGDRDEKSIVGYQLKFNIYLHGNWTSCPYGDQFHCKDDNCIWNKLICDGAMNCPDMSDEYEATHAVCRNPLNLGLQILCFFGAVGAIVITLLTLDALGRYVLHSREVRSKLTRRPHVRPTSLLVVEEEQAVAPVHGVHGAPINLLDRDLALFEKQAAAESHDKKEKTVEGGKGAAPIEMAPRLGSAPRHSRRSTNSSPSLGILSHGKSTDSSRSRGSSPLHELTDCKLSTLSYELDFDAYSSKLRVPDVTPEESMLVEDEKHFPSDKPLKSTEAFMRLLELTVGKKTVPERRGILSNISPLPHSSTTTSSRTTPVQSIASLATTSAPYTPIQSSPLPSPDVLQKQRSRTPKETPELSYTPSTSISSQPVPSSPLSVSNMTEKRVPSSPSASSVSRTVSPRSRESSRLKESKYGKREGPKPTVSRTRSPTRSPGKSKQTAENVNPAPSDRSKKQPQP